MPQLLSRVFQALGFGYLGDLALGWTSIWLAPHTADRTWRFYMAPGEWFVNPVNAPFMALLFWTAIFGAGVLRRVADQSATVAPGVMPWLCLALSLLLQGAAPQASRPTDITIAPGANYDKAEFRLWLPPNIEKVRAVVVLVPGSNGDGRPMADDKFWQDFAVAQKVALVACRFTDKQHDQSFIEEYVNVSKGSGQALLDAIAQFSNQSHHPELLDSKLFLWGMSAGGEFNYEFVAWKPEKVAAFIVNKGGIYYTALAPKAAREVPGILFVGEKDLDSRTFTIKGLFGVNRRAGALWALAEEPGLAHVVGKSQELGAMLFDEVLNAPAGSLNAKSGVVADIHTLAIQPAATASINNILTSWFVSDRLAKAWLSATAK